MSAQMADTEHPDFVAAAGASRSPLCPDCGAPIPTPADGDCVTCIELRIYTEVHTISHQEQAAWPESLWNALAQSQSKSIKLYVSEQALAPSSALSLLVDKEAASKILCNVASHPHTRTATLTALSFRSNQAVVACVAAHPNTAEEVLQRLMHNKSYWSDIASNPSISSDMQRHLFHSGDWQTHCGLASNPGIPDTVLQALAKMAYNEIAFCVARNPTASAKTLRNICQRDNAKSREQRHIKTPKVQREVAAHPNAPPDLVESFIATGDVLLFHVIAGRPDASSDMLHTIATSKNTDDDLLCSVAKHPNALPETVFLLSMDSSMPKSSLAATKRMANERRLQQVR